MRKRKIAMSRTSSCYVYAWAHNEAEREVTDLRIYGIDSNDKNVCLRVTDFTPYVYMELPDRIQWNDIRAQMVSNKIDDIMRDNTPLKKTLVWKHKLYFAHLDKNGEKKLFPFLCLAFSSVNDIGMFKARTKGGFVISDVGHIKVRLHEDNATPVLQLVCVQDIPTAGWVKFSGKSVPEEERVSTCEHEYKVSYKSLADHNCTVVVHPKIMFYDIEAYSSNPNKMPNPRKPSDKIFQVSCIFARVGDKDCKKYLLTLGEPDVDAIGDDVEVLACETEASILEQFTQLIQDEQPNVICGYNIFKFDIPYMIDRARLTGVFDIFDRQGFTRAHSLERNIKWSSSACKNQEFKFIDAEGRIFVDMLPLIVRNHGRMSDYSLKSVSTHFLGESKDPLTPKAIFKCYQMGMDALKLKNTGAENMETENMEKKVARGEKALGIVGKYCIQDSMLVAKLFSHLNTWYELTELARVWNIPVPVQYMQGQQVRVFSQIYKECMAANIVVERDGYIPKENEHYQGAHVFLPKPGVYDRVAPFDFSSLYPSIIISHNIDYSTLVPDDTEEGRAIPNEKCHIFDWDEHVGCAHDTEKRKTKPKHVLCGHRHFRFLKEPKGVLPLLVEKLIAKRKEVRKGLEGKIKKLKDATLTPEERATLQVQIIVDDQKQLGLKVSANSAYGAMGVQKGFLPLMPGAMTVTAVGRKSIMKVADMITTEYKGELVYGDTDSNYVRFPHLQTAPEIWKWAEHVSAEVSKHFPKPMKLEFEGAIYWRFLILTRKRYMSNKVDETGTFALKKGTKDVDIQQKGVLLARRDYSPFVQTLYRAITMMIFEYADVDDILYKIIESINIMCAHGFQTKDFAITKSVGAVDKNIVPIVGSKGKGKCGDYTVAMLAEPGSKKRAEQMKKKNAQTETEYYERCLPAQVQLAEKIRRRGGRVDVGTRLKYLIIETPKGTKAKQYEQIESYDYFCEHSSVLRIDYMYYTKALVNPIDQIIECVADEKLHGFMKDQYKLRLQKQKMLAQLKLVFQPKLRFL